MTLHRLNHALAFVFGGYQDYDKFYSPSLLDEDAGLFVAILEQLTERTQHIQRSSGLEPKEGKLNEIESRGNTDGNTEGKTATPSDEETGTAPAQWDNEPQLEEPEGPPSEREKSEVMPADEGPSAQSTSSRHNQDAGGEEGASGENYVPSVEMTGEEVNAARLATAHVQLKRLKGHHCNIFEAAFFYGPEGDRGEYYLNILQVVVTYCAMFFLFYFLGAEIRKQFKNRNVFLQDKHGNDKEWQGILAINAIALGYFFFLVGRDVERVVLFNKCMIKLCPNDQYTSYSLKSHRWWSLFNNFCVNVVLGYCLFVLNFFFVQSVDNMKDAILNAIAVVFIIQIDDIIPPYVRIYRKVYFLSIPMLPMRINYWFDWENFNIHFKMMAVVEEFLSRQDSPEEAITVKKISGQSVLFQESDVCYFFVNKEECLIRIFHGRIMNAKKYKHWFKEVCYKVEGHGAERFVKNMSYFECVEEEEGPKKLEVNNATVVTRSQIQNTPSLLNRNGLPILRARKAQSGS
mmetsp:Transcript_22602/g.62874  ORF Transcript_22602/g.62874 Transcript_22602/m.62874 type:complete len:517 (+) Transcript_22602:181-1731(+)|eukprot:CAMPEP_0168720104 /NCGR_PEP_ID=MMETSP0724-20121128/1387_1 /TAXON_ID=265536 /ORGANISM="Amphiprora sp., Strain CCMP467" /LENGTH=516 /DNA_ID=CAMNT_0008766689 /DNA_START=118 /DNA_END=1668 /DNA_ORIENTATION=-